MTFKYLSEMYFRMADRAEDNGKAKLADLYWQRGVKYAAAHRQQADKQQLAEA